MGYDTAYQCLDGTQILSTRSVELPDNVERSDLYCWKHRWPQGRNCQAVVSHFGHCTELVIGPGAMNDAAMSRYCCLNDDDGSTLCDGTYPSSRPEFICSDQSDAHSEGRSLVERYFGRMKCLWKMVGTVFCKDKKYMDMTIRAAALLTNLVIQDEGGLNQWYS